MCGIVAYVGLRPDVTEILIKGLGRLEYRGYDSAGVVLLNNSTNEDGELELTRSVGKVAMLADKMNRYRVHVNMHVNRQVVKKVRMASDESVKKVESVLVILDKSKTVGDLIEAALDAYANERDLFVERASVIFKVHSQEAALDSKTALSDLVDRDLFAFDLFGEEDPAGKPPPSANDQVFVGMGHTRWATHGEPCERNSHPHLSNNGKVAVVHNGIIENQSELRAGLIQLGYKFKSDTDTELIPVLIEHYARKSATFEDAVFKAISKLRGAFGLCIMRQGDPTIYGVRLGSPVCLGIGSNGKENFLGSEPAAFVGLTSTIIHLEDFEVAIIRSDSWKVKKIQFHSAEDGTDGQGGVTDMEDNDKVKKSFMKSAHAKSVANINTRIIAIPGDIIDHQKGQHPHFMLKEIHEQPDAIARTISGKNSMAALDRIDIRLPMCLQHVLFLACGTSYHAGQIAEYVIENNVGLPVRTRHASEYLTAKCLLTSNDLVIAISQSGETADTRQALSVAKDHGASVAGLVNVVGSQIARLAGQGMYLKAGPEIGVASTKAFSCQVAAGNLLAAFLSRDVRPTGFRQECIDALQEVPGVLRSLINDKAWMKQCEEVGEWVSKANHALYLGRGIDFPVALEGALKLKEISYIHAEGYPAGEMKHGPIALIDEDMPVFFVIGKYRDATGSTGGEIYEKTRSNMAEVKSRKGKIVVVTDFHTDPSLAELATAVIRVPHITENVSPMIKVLPLQLIAYHAAVKKGLDPDKPRNLAKSVTVQ
eukprot:TRINITY_DN13940_c0_g1_i1.p1 TRINITY_DN13940_c0_g1~~TRINITY_DN13940_c0_g1_i1.p1  ORF type:complete len:775 (-),score=234.56 TRINITY_DN13940_c0_g1_i1:152-2452(-)